MPTVEGYVDEIPPSSNAKSSVGGRSNPNAQARVKKDWQGKFAVVLLTMRLPRNLAFVRVTPRLEFKRNGKAPDSDNFYFPISKPLGDALTAGGWLPDDDPEHYACERPRITMGCTKLPPLAKGRTVLVVEYEEAAE